GRAHLPLEIQALAQLGIHLVTDSQRQSPQRVHGRVQHFLAITDQAAQFAAGDLRSNALARAAADELHLVTIGIALPRYDLQPCDAASYHQRLATADEDVETAVILRD